MNIPRRDVDFGLTAQGIPRDWCANDAFVTAFVNALSLLFPEGERFFVDSVKQHKDHVTDPELAREVVGFIGQEAMHGKEHRAFNALLVEHGFTATSRVDRRLRWLLGRVRETLPPASQLAATCALEHFTAMLAEQLLSNPRWQDDFDPSIRPLWLWHALEESEHKAVAFDVFRAAGGGYVRRVLIMVIATIVFFAFQFMAQAMLLRDRGILFRPWRWVRGATRLWIYPGYLTRLVPAYLAYFLPGFHPSDRNTSALLENWRTQLFGAGGLLDERVRVIA